MVLARVVVRAHASNANTEATQGASNNNNSSSSSSMMWEAAGQREGNDIRAEDMLQEPEMPGEIERFYEDAAVLVTGATGFVGKVLVEKLLRTCHGMRTLYLLVRTKKGKQPHERFKDMFDDTLFNRLRNERPGFESKLRLVQGDMELPRLGLSDADYTTLSAEVDVVLHVAATVRFDETLRKATAINVCGTREILALARRMPNLRAFVHVSTAYAHCPRRDIEERVYESAVGPQRLLDIVGVLDDVQLEAVTPHLLADWPNTYVFTKAVAELVVAGEEGLGAGLPVAVVRPSIVISTAKEPVAGWIDNLYGATGIAVGAAVGLIRTLHCQPDNLADLVPVDYVVNCILAASWRLGRETAAGNKHARPQEPLPVYNCVGSVQAPISWREYMRQIEVNAYKIPSPVTLWHYCFRLNPNYYVHLLTVYLLHYLPAVFVDAFLVLIARKPMLVKSYKKINKFGNVISYFSSRQWRFRNDNVQTLWQQLGDTDQAAFDFDMSALSWDEYFYSYVRGMRVYLLKDPLDTIPQGRVKFWKLKMAHYFLVTLLLYGLLRLCLAILSPLLSAF